LGTPLSQVAWTGMATHSGEQTLDSLFLASLRP